MSRRKNARLLEKRKKGTHLKVQHRENSTENEGKGEKENKKRGRERGRDRKKNTREDGKQKRTAGTK